MQPSLPNKQDLIPLDPNRTIRIAPPNVKTKQNVYHRIRQIPDLSYNMNNSQQSLLIFEANQQPQSSTKPSTVNSWETVLDLNRSVDKPINDQKTIESPENNESTKPCLAATPSYFKSLQCYDNVLDVQYDRP